MDVGKQGDAELHHVGAEHGTLPGTVQGNGQGGGGGHGAHGGQIGGAVVLYDLNGVPAGICAGGAVKDGQPDVMARHDDDDSQQEGGKLLGDGAVIAEAAEGQGNEEGQDGNDHLLYHAENDILEFLEHGGDGPGLGPDSRQADEDGEHQGAHHRHDLGDLQLERYAGQLFQALHSGGDGQVGDQDVTGDHGHQGRQDRADVGNDNGNAQHTGGVGTHPGDGRGDEADDNQGDAEHDELIADVFQGDHDGHDALRQEQPQYDTGCNADKKFTWQAFQKIHTISSSNLPKHRFALCKIYDAQPPVMMRMISLSVSRIPRRPRRPMLAIVFSTPLETMPSPPRNCWLLRYML